MSRVLGKYLQANRTVDGLRGEPRRFLLPAGRVRLWFNFLMRRRLSTEFFDDLKSTPKASGRPAGEPGGMLF